MEWQRVADIVFRVFFVGLLYMLVASAVLHSFMAHEGFVAGDGDLSLESFVDGTGRRPFVHRVTAHHAVRAAADLVPPDLVEAHETYLLETSPLQGYLTRGTGTLRESLLVHVGYVWCFGCLMALLFALRALTTSAFPRGPPAAADLAPALALVFLPQTFLLGGYLYDFAELALLTAALVALWRRSWLGFAVCFVLGVLTKETALFWLVLAGGVWGPDTDRRPLVAYLGSLGGVGAGIVGAIGWAHADNPGGGIELHLLDNLRFWLWWPTYFSTMPSYAPFIPVPRGGHVFQLFLVGFVVFRGWPVASPRVRWVFGSMAAIHVPLFLAFGFYDEIRALGPLLPGLYLLAGYALPQIWPTGLTSASDRP